MKRSIALILALLMAFSFSCFSEDEVADPQEMNRIIPPVSTMKIDFFTVPGNDSGSGKCSMDNDETACAAGALVIVGISNLIFYTPLAIPIAIFSALKDQIPTSASPDHVEWEYSYTDAAENTYTVSVIADYNDATEEWEWSVSFSDSENTFTWITGGSQADNSGGWWQFHQPTADGGSKETIGVVWEYNSETDMSVTFVNNDTTNTLMDDDYVEYKRDGNDVSVTFYDECSTFFNTQPCEKQETVVYWNLETEAGGITIDIKADGVIDSECNWDPADE